jgi:hypothetical protein
MAVKFSALLARIWNLYSLKNKLRTESIFENIYNNKITKNVVYNKIRLLIYLFYKTRFFADRTLLPLNRVSSLMFTRREQAKLLS